MGQDCLKRIAVLMTVHNRRDITLECLRRLSAMQYDREQAVLDIFMTDDGCTDGTADAVMEASPGVHVIQGNGELYWNRGMYAAWQEALKYDHDYYWWVNDDTFVFEDTLSRMLDSSAAHGDRAIIVGCTCASDGSGTVTYGGVVKSKVVSGIDEPHECETFNGNLVLIPRRVFESIGTNDPRFRHALGDIDYGLRATEAGIDIWTVSGACGVCNLHGRPAVWMDPDQPFKDRWNNFFSPLGNNPFEFFRFRLKHYGFFAACATFASNFLHFLFPGAWKNLNPSK